MSDNLPPEPDPPAEAGIPTTVTSISGGVNLDAQRIDIGGDVVGRDKIVQNIQNIYERALTAAEQARQARSIEVEYLAQGVSAFAQRLQARAAESIDASIGGPYKGLLEYRLSDAEIFFGRDRAIRELLEHLQRGPLTALHAESGAGKTSLLQAGVSPHLIAAGHLPIYLRPYNVTPSLAIKRAFLPNLSDTPNLAQAPLRDFLARASNVLGTATALYIFLDQFEEFFTQLEETARPEFVRELAECLDDESLNVRWVLALRSEYFGNLASFRPRIRNPFENDYRLNRLTHDEAHEAVAKPAAQRGISFEDGLIDTILDDLGKDEVEPPQVQLVCSTLYETLPPTTKVITRELYTAQGGAAGILRGHLGRVLKRDLPANQRPIAQHLLEELITSDIHRVMRTHAELAGALTAQDVKTETLDAVLSQLVDSRLLRVEETEGEPAYELVHDYLLGEIKLDPTVQARKAAQELLDQEVRAFQRHGTLLSDDKLAIIEARRDELTLSADAKTVIQKSERAFKRRQRFVFGGIGLVVALIIIGSLSVFGALGAQSAANQARTQQATSEAGAATASAREVNANQAAAVAGTSEANANQAAIIAATNESQAKASAATATAREAVANATLNRAFEKSGIVPVGNKPYALAYDGIRLWVANYDDGTVQSIDPATGNAGTPIKVGDGPCALAYDGARLWVANGTSDTVQEINLTTGNVGEPIPVGKGPCALAYDGARLWVANVSADTVQGIDPMTGKIGISVKVDRVPNALAYDGVSLWVSTEVSDTVQGIDPLTGYVIGAIKVGADPWALAYDGRRLWVGNAGDDTVQSIDLTMAKVGAPIKVGRSPRALAYDGTRLWVANTLDGTVQSIDPTTDDISLPVKVGFSPRALAYDGTHLWVAHRDNGTVEALNPTIGDIGAPITFGQNYWPLGYYGTRLWFVNQVDGMVQSIDPTTSAIGLPIEVGSFLQAFAYDGTLLWFISNADSTIRAIDPVAGKVGASIRVGRNPLALAYDGTQLWVADGDDQTVRSIDPATGKMGTAIKVGSGPIDLAYHGTRLWVISSADSTIQSIDPATGKMGTAIKVGSGPIRLAYDGTRLWVISSADSTIQSIDPATGKMGTAIKVGSGPIDLAYDGTQLWVADWDAKMIQPINPTTGKVGMPVTVDSNPGALVYDGTRLWVFTNDRRMRAIHIYKGTNK